MIKIEVVIHFPVPTRLHHSFAYNQRMPRQDFPNALKERLAVKTELKGEVILQSLEICFDILEEGK